MGESPDRWQQYNLAAKERDVLLQIADGRSTMEIAHALGMRVKLVYQFQRSLYIKLEVGDRPSLIRKARGE